MYVQCERCKTEYDFDDALVSERGTTVKCTQCGHQFKVRRGAGTVVEAGSDRWVVTTVSGKTLVFTSLRELQKAILGKQVARGDSLARGSGPPRILGGIAELEPFFDGKRTSMAASSEVQPQAGTHRSSRPPPPPGNESHPLEPPKRGRIDTLRPPMEHGTAMPPPAAAQERVSPFAKTASPATAALASTLPHMQAPAVPSRTPPPPFVVPPPEPTIPTPPPQMVAPPPDAPTMPAIQVEARPPQPYMPEMSSPLPPPAMRASRPPQDSYLEPRPSLADSLATPARRPMGGWVVAAVLFLGVCVLGFFVAKPYLLSGPPKPTASLAPLDPKAQKLLEDGERALSDGDLDGAKENFDKASMLADKDPRVLLGIARVANARADVAWLKVRLLPPDSGEPLALAKKDLDDLAVKGKAAAEAALASAPDDPAAMRAKMDALRITGDLSGARALVPPTSSIASQPESAYVLAALDLSEPTAPTAQVLTRLRDAADAERNLGRARGALVYALARSGDPVGARREIERLLALPKPYALLAPLRAFVDRAPAPTGDAGPVAVMNVNALPTGAAVGTGGGGGSNDPRVLLQQADTARQHGDLDKAKTLYGKALELNPSDSEALAGLGQVAHAQHDMANAQTYYRRAMAANGTYLPAMVGLADVLWDSGDKPGAQKIYKDVVDRFPEAAYASYVKQRAEGGGGGGATPAPTPSDPAP